MSEDLSFETSLKVTKILLPVLEIVPGVVVRSRPESCGRRSKPIMLEES